MHASNPEEGGAPPEEPRPAGAWLAPVQRLTRIFRPKGTNENDPPESGDRDGAMIDDQEDDIAAAAEAKALRLRMPHMAEVADYLRARNLPPLPIHYEAAWIALGGPASIEGEEAPGPAADQLCTRTLDSLIGDAQGTLDDMSSLIDRSRAEASAYGSALETQVDGNTPPVLDILISLTRKMIARTRATDERMRAMGMEMDSLQRHLAEARTIARRDALTGLDNRRAIDMRLDQAIERLATEPDGAGGPLVLAYCDIDHFKAINDRLGHDVGDRVLKLVARVLSDGAGAVGHAARYGGEEFLLMFEGLSMDEAERRVDAVRRDLARRMLRRRDTGAPIGAVTFSAGLAAWQVEEARADLLRRADAALYRAKDLGRNRVELG
jgi:diguanylate cyclase